MKIIEQLCMGKRAGTPCEDGWVVTPHFAAVIDGSTAKIPLQPGEESPGHYAMRHVNGAIAMLPPDATKEEALLQLTRAIGTRHPYASRHYRPTCSAVIYSRQRHEVWMIGDCQFRYEGCTHTNEKPADRILAGIRADVLRAALLRGNTVDSLRRNDVGRACILDALCLQCQFQNAPEYNPYSFVVLDGFPIDVSRVPVYVLPPATDVPLILASDGYPELCDTFEATELRLRRMLHADPLCMEKYVATKGWMEGYSSFDDRTYVRFYPG